MYSVNAKHLGISVHAHRCIRSLTVDHRLDQSPGRGFNLGLEAFGDPLGLWNKTKSWVDGGDRLRRLRYSVLRTEMLRY